MRCAVCGFWEDGGFGGRRSASVSHLPSHSAAVTAVFRQPHPARFLMSSLRRSSAARSRSTTVSLYCHSEQCSRPAKTVSGLVNCSQGGCSKWRQIPVCSAHEFNNLILWRPLLPCGYSYPAPDRIKQSFAIFDIRALWRSRLSARVPGCQKWCLQMTT